MDDDVPARVPTHADIADGLAAVLAAHRDDLGALHVISARWRSAADMDAFIVGLLTSFAAYVARKQADPESYLTQWILVEQLRHDEQQGGPPQG